MTSNSWRQVAVAVLLTAGMVGCSGGLLRRNRGGDECESCHYGCCDTMDGSHMGGYVDYGGMNASSGGCTSCGQTPNLMPIGDNMLGQGMMEQVPSQPAVPRGMLPTPVPSAVPGRMLPGPVTTE